MGQNKSITLYEFGEWFDYDKDVEALEHQLLDVWKTRKDESDEDEDDEDVISALENEVEVAKADFQPFLSFSHKKGIRARNWVGFIQDSEQLIEIYPKVFKNSPVPNETMLQHIFYWLCYSSKQRFPYTQAGLYTIEAKSFPELIIYLIASHLKEILEEKPLALYHEVEERMQMPRGRLNFQRYINNSLVTGQWHQMECDYEPFVFDNAVNRIIKYCVRLLEQQTGTVTIPEQQTGTDTNINLLRDITFILDEVEDVPCSIKDVQKIKLNSFFEEYEIALDYCKMILEQQIYSSESYEMNRWTMLLPMELLFEDFIAGFIKEHFSKEWNVKFQKGEMCVVDEPKEAFRMKHDIYLESKSSGRKIIIDTKYKIRSERERKKPKKGVSQADIYQMITYAVKRDCKDVILMYPCELNKATEEGAFTVKYGQGGQEEIKIHIVSVPFWCESGFDKEVLEEKLKSVLIKFLKIKTIDGIN